MDDNNFETLKAQYEHPQPKKGPNKTLRLIILSIIGVIVIAAIAIGILLLVKPKTTSAPTVTSAQQIGGPTASDVIAQINANETIAQATGYWQYQLNDTSTKRDTDTSLVYKDDNYAFLTDAAPGDGIQFTRMDESTPSTKAAITAAVTDTLKKAGFSEAQQDVSVLTAAKVTTYTNKGTVCQLIDYDGALSLAEQSIVCATTAQIDSSYSIAKTLLDKAGSSISTQAKLIVQKTITDGTKKLYDITVATDDTAKSSEYYFGALDTNGEYTYLGNRGVGQVDDAASFTVSDLLKKNVADTAAWGTFLTDNIKL